jgi:hypothetical protein
MPQYRTDQRTGWHGIIHNVQGQVLVYGPDPHTLPEMKVASDLGTLHIKLMQEDKSLVYLMYNGVHYNPIIYNNMPPLN